MKTINFTFLFIFLLSFNVLKAQNEFEIKIFDSTIQNAPIHDCGDIEKAGREVLQYTIKNERKTDVEIINIKTPQGYMASTSTNVIESKDEATIYIMIERKFIENTGDFNEKIIIKTNLIQDIEIELKGVYLE
jgi:ribosomal protein S6